MAKVEKRTKDVKSFKKKGSKKGMNLILPVMKSVRATTFEEYTTLIHGEKKIGKSTLASYFKNSLMMFFEPGSKALEVFSVAIPDWEYFTGYISLLEKREHNYKNVVIDTGDICYKRCFEYVCYQRHVKHPSDANDYGATWKFIEQEFERAHSRLMNMGMGLIVIAHSQEKEFKDRNGEKFERIVPVLSKQADEYYAGVLDNIFYYDYQEKKRFLTIRGDSGVVAGTRCEKNFLTPSGERIEYIPMGKSAKEAYQNLVKAFNNEQVKTYKEEEEVKSKEMKSFKKKKRRRV